MPTSFSTNGTGGGDWKLGTTWNQTSCSSSCSAGTDYPGSGDTAFINGTDTVTMSQNETVTEIHIAAGAELDGVSNWRLTVDGAASGGSGMTTNFSGKTDNLDLRITSTKGQSICRLNGDTPVSGTNLSTFYILLSSASNTVDLYGSNVHNAGNITIAEGELKMFHTNASSPVTAGTLKIEAGGTYTATSGVTTLTARESSVMLDLRTGTFNHNFGTMKLAYATDNSNAGCYVGDTVADTTRMNPNVPARGKNSLYNVVLESGSAGGISSLYGTGSSSIDIAMVHILGSLHVKSQYAKESTPNGAAPCLVVHGPLIIDEGAIFDISGFASGTTAPAVNRREEHFFLGGIYNHGSFFCNKKGAFSPTVYLAGTGSNIEGDLSQVHDLRILQDPTLNLDGAGDYVTVADHGNLDITGDIVMSAWVNITLGEGNFQTIISKSSACNNSLSPWQMRIDDNDKLECVIGTGSADTRQQSTSVLTAGWHHVALSIDESASPVVKYYIDGVLDVTRTFAGTTYGSYSNSSALILGYLGPGSCYPFKGRLADVKIYDHKLSDDDIAHLASGINVHPNIIGNSSSLIAWWKLNDNSSTIVDYSLIVEGCGRSANNGTIVGDPTWDLNGSTRGVEINILNNTTTVNNLTIQEGRLNTKSLMYTNFDGGGGTKRWFDMSSNILDYGSTDAFTISFWYKYLTGNHGNQGTIFSTQNAAGDQGFRIGHGGTNFTTRMAGSDRSTDSSSGLTPNAAGWYHVIFTRGISGSYAFYINGILDNNATSGFNVDIRDSVGAESTSSIGIKLSEPAETTKYLAGGIRDLRIYDYEIGKAEASALAAGSYPQTPLHWYKLDEGTGNGTDSGVGTTAAANANSITWTDGTLYVNGAIRRLTNASVT